jgi:hypothetical protein
MKRAWGILIAIFLILTALVLPVLADTGTPVPTVTAASSTVSGLYVTVRGTVSYTGTVDSFWFEFAKTGDTPEKVSGTLDTANGVYSATIGPLPAGTEYTWTACCQAGGTEYRSAARTVHTASAAVITLGAMDWSKITPQDPSALDAKTQINMILLNSLLRDRPEALRTLFGTNYLSDSFMSCYQNCPVLSTFINFEDVFVYNAGDYFTDAISYLPRKVLNSISNAEAKEILATLVSDQRYNHFQAALNAVFTSEYTSTDKYTYSYEQSNYQSINSASKTASDLKKHLDNIKEYTDIWNTVDDSYRNYYNYNFLPAYSQTLNNYLTDLQGITVNDLVKSPELTQTFEKNLSAATTAMERYENYDFADGRASLWKLQTDQHIFGQGIADMVDITGKTVQTTAGALETWVVADNVAAGGESLNGTLGRLRTVVGTSSAKAGSLGSVLEYYQEMISNTTKSQVVSTFGEVYDDLLAGAVKSKIGEFARDKVLKAVCTKFGTSAGLGCYAALGKANAILNGVKIGGLITEIVGSTETAVKKAIELRSLYYVESQLRTLLQQDFDRYAASQTEENAKQTLADLMFYKGLKLREVTAAKELLTALDGSFANELFNNNDTAYWENQYQTQRDALVDAQIVKSREPYTVESGETYTLSSFNADRLLGGVTVKGTLDGGGPLCATYLDINGGTVRLTGKAFTAGELTVNGTVELTNETAQIARGYTQSGGSVTLNGTSLTVDGPFSLTGGVLSVGSGQTELRDEASITENCLKMSEGAGKLLADEKLTINSSSGHSACTAGTLEVKKDLVSNTVFTTGGTHRLLLSGAQKQTVSGSYALADLTFTNTSADGVAITGSIGVNGALENAATKVTNGKAVTLNAGGSITGNDYNSDLTLNGTTLPQALRFGGSVYTKNACSFGSDLKTAGSLNAAGDLNCGGNVTVGGSYIVSGTGKTHTYTDGTTVTVSGDASMSDIKILNSPDFRLSGDWVSSTASTPGMTLTLCGRLGQKVTGALTLAGLRIQNTSTEGTTLQNAINVTGKLYGNAGLLKGSKNICLCGSAVLPDGVFHGALCSRDYTFTAPARIDGGLTYAGNLTVDTPSVTIGGTLGQSGSGTLTVNAGDQLTVTGDFASAASSTATGGGMLTVGGDVYNGGTFQTDNLALNGKLPQTISGNALTVKKLTLANSSASGVTIGTVVNISESYAPGSTRVTNAANAKVSLNGADLSASQTISGDLHIAKDMTIHDCTLILDGNLYLDGGTLTIKNAAVTVNKRVIASGSAAKSLVIGADGSLTVKRTAVLASAAVTNAGRLVFCSDCVLTGGSLTGAGSASFRGDLAAGSCSVALTGKTDFSSKFFQVISGSSLTFGDLTFSNPSRDGVRLDSTVNYTGTLDKGAAVIANEGKLVHK